MDTATESPHPVRTVGVEEELLLVDARTGAPRSVASQVLSVARERGDADERGGSVGPELQQEQIETDTPPEEDLGRLEVDLGEWRDKARAAAAEVGALVLASGTAPLPAHPRAYADPRYAQLTERFGLTATEQLACGCHVHVSVASDDEAVGTLDRIRVWLPALLAVSANSPFWQGVSSGYDSYRSQLLTRWPTNGPTELFGTGQRYRDHLQRLVDTGVLLDEAMDYSDARPSRRYPTLELRVADVCLDIRDAVLVAALGRGLVETGAVLWARGEEPAPASVAVLRLAMWQAGKYGVSGELLDPETHRPRPAREVVEALVAHVGPALDATGDAALVEDGLERIFTTGTGAARQRAMLAQEGRLDRAVVQLAQLT